MQSGRAICRRFSGLHPNVALEFIDYPLESYFKNFVNNNFDITTEYMSGYLFEEPGYSFIKLMEDRHCCGMSPTHPLAMKKKITIDNPADTRILSISVIDPDPQMAKAIADKIAATASDYVGDIMEMVPPKLIEEGEIPILRSSPSNVKNALIGSLLGAVLVCGAITVNVVMNDTIRTEEDVAKYLGLSVLASVPEREGEKPEDKEAMISSKSRNKTASGKSRKKKRGGQAS